MRGRSTAVNSVHPAKTKAVRASLSSDRPYQAVLITKPEVTSLPGGSEYLDPQRGFAGSLRLGPQRSTTSLDLPDSTPFSQSNVDFLRCNNSDCDQTFAMEHEWRSVGTATTKSAPSHMFPLLTMSLERIGWPATSSRVP